MNCSSPALDYPTFSWLNRAFLPATSVGTLVIGGECAGESVFTCAVIGLDGALIEVVADLGMGLPAFDVVGLPDASVQESHERVGAAIRNSGCVFPLRRVTVNLAPTDLKKEGPAYDLPIALALVMASQQVPAGDGTALFLWDGHFSLATFQGVVAALDRRREIPSPCGVIRGVPELSSSSVPPQIMRWIDVVRGT